MKSFIRLSFLMALVAMLAFVPAATTRAQDDCFGLESGDCELLKAAEANTGVTAFVMDYDMTLRVAGLPQGQDVDFKLDGSGPIDFSALVGATDQTAAIKDLVMQNVINIAYTMGEQSEDATVEIRIVDGTLYFNDGEKGWQKQSIEQAMASSMSGFPMGGMMGGMGGMSSTTSPKITEVLSMLSQIEGVVTTTAEDGPEVDGVATREITVNLNIAALLKGLNTPEGKELIMSLVAMSGQEIPEEELTTQLSQVSMFAAALQTTLDNTSLSFGYLVGSTDNNIHGFNLDFTTTVDQQTATAFSNGQLTAPIDVDFHFTVQLSDINEPVTVEPVAEAVEVEN